jgi:cell division transport system permease protein
MLDRIEFLLGEAFVALRRNGWMTFAAISTAAVALFLLGGLAYVSLKAYETAEHMSEKFDLRVQLRPDVSEEKVQEVSAAIEKMEGVATVTHIPKEEAWAEFKKQFHSELVSDLDNPLPESFRVSLTDLEHTEAVVAKIRGLRSVDPKHGVVYKKEDTQFMYQLLGVLRVVGGTLGSLLLLTSGVLIYNAIRLTVVARRKEIRIMQLVGAAQSTVRTPFVIEGTIQGMVGGFVATLLIWLSQWVVYENSRSIDAMASAASFPFWTIVAILCGVGASIGCLCSWLAVREPLRLRAGGNA